MASSSPPPTPSSCTRFPSGIRDLLLLHGSLGLKSKRSRCSWCRTKAKRDDGGLCKRAESPEYIRTVRPHLSRTSGFMPRLLRPWAFESSTDLLLWPRTTSSRHEEPGESLARADAPPWLRKGKCYRKHAGQPLASNARRERVAKHDEVEETTRARNCIVLSYPRFNDQTFRINDAYAEQRR